MRRGSTISKRKLSAQKQYQARAPPRARANPALAAGRTACNPAPHRGSRGVAPVSTGAARRAARRAVGAHQHRDCDGLHETSVGAILTHPAATPHPPPPHTHRCACVGGCGRASAVRSSTSSAPRRASVAGLRGARPPSPRRRRRRGRRRLRRRLHPRRTAQPPPPPRLSP